MAYTNGIYYVDYVNGSDAARPSLLNAVASNNGSGGVRITYNNHGLITGAIVNLTNFTAYLNGVWKITVIDANSFDLDTAVWATTADPIGDVSPNGGSSWADALKTVNSLAASRYSGGDEFRFAKTPDPTSMGQNAIWRTRTQQYTSSGSAITSSTNASPIVITRAGGHNLITGDFVQIKGHTVNTNSNGFWKVTKISDTQFSLDGSAGNGVGGATGTFHYVTNKVVELTNAVTVDVCNCNQDWTVGANVTSATLFTTDWKMEKGCIRIVTGAGAGANQILAKYGLANPIDLSSYQQLSFWFKSSVTLNDGDLELRLYSDAACTNQVEAYLLIATKIANSWMVHVYNKGSALSNSVQGIALFTKVALASRTFYIDNIIASKASNQPDSLTLRSLIAKNEVNNYGDHVFVGLQAIIGKYLIIDNATNTLPHEGLGYYGVSETRTIYKREPVYFEAPSAVGGLLVPLKSSTLGNNIKFIGGWNTVSNTRDGITVYDAGNSNGILVSLFSKAYYELHYFQGVRLNAIELSPVTYVKITNTYITNSLYLLNNQSPCTHELENIVALQVRQFSQSVLITNSLLRNFIGIGATSYALYVGQSITLDNIRLYNNRTGAFLTNGWTYTLEDVVYSWEYGIQLSSDSNYEISLNGLVKFNTYAIFIPSGVNRAVFNYINDLSNNQIALYSSASSGNVFKEINKLNSNSIILGGGSNAALNYWLFHKVNECDANGAILSAKSAVDVYFYNVNFTGNTPEQRFDTGAYKVYFFNCKGLPFSTDNIGTGIFDESRIFHHRYNQTENDHRILANGGYIFSDSVERHTASGISWATYITHSFRNINAPLILNVGKVKVVAGDNILISAWVKKSHATDIGAKLIVSRFKTLGLSNDVSVDAANNTDWQLLSMQLTVSITGVVEIDLQTYYVNSVTEKVWIDDVSVTKL